MRLLFEIHCAQLEVEIPEVCKRLRGGVQDAAASKDDHRQNKRKLKRI